MLVRVLKVCLNNPKFSLKVNKKKRVQNWKKRNLKKKWKWFLSLQQKSRNQFFLNSSLIKEQLHWVRNHTLMGYNNRNLNLSSKLTSKSLFIENQKFKLRKLKNTSHSGTLFQNLKKISKLTKKSLHRKSEEFFNKKKVSRNSNKFWHFLTYST